VEAPFSIMLLWVGFAGGLVAITAVQLLRQRQAHRSMAEVIARVDADRRTPAIVRRPRSIDAHRRAGPIIL
jgi:hypothetical protein